MVLHKKAWPEKQKQKQRNNNEKQQVYSNLPADFTPNFTLSSWPLRIHRLAAK